MKNTRTFSKKQHKYKYSKKNINTKKKRITKKNIYKRKRYKQKVYGGAKEDQSRQTVPTVPPKEKVPLPTVQSEIKDPKTTTQYIIFQIPDLYAPDKSKDISNNKLKYFINITHTDLNKIENVDDLLYILKKSRNGLLLNTDVKIEEAVTEHNTKKSLTNNDNGTNEVKVDDIQITFTPDNTPDNTTGNTTDNNLLKILTKS